MNDQTAAANLEITSALADAAEEILRDFAENAELDVALVVDHSGALIAGIAADEDVHVETVGALVAGTVGSIRALGKAVGEQKSLESMHHGVETVVYLRELNQRFIVVGAADVDIPAGIIREVAARISNPLLAVLIGEEILEKDEAQEPFDLTDVSAPIQEEEPEESAAIEPLVVDSPFEFADDDEDEDEIVADGMVFDLGGDDKLENDEPDGETDEIEVAAPLLVSPVMPTEEEVAKSFEEGATTAVAAITTPIATDIGKKIKNTDSANPEKPEPEEDAAEDGDDDGDPVGGPRYVFEIG